ncbi:MAG: hypothetical protein ACLURG_09865 [Gemmiger sp.]
MNKPSAAVPPHILGALRPAGLPASGADGLSAGVHLGGRRRWTMS